MKDQIRQLRQEYHTDPLRQEDMDLDPLVEFQRWFAAAIEREPFEANAMTLATCDSQGKPSARVVLLKELDARGFVFFSNYLSRKGQEMAANPQASLVFYWPQQHRQVRVEGVVERLPEADSDSYFESRPRGSRLGAWASQQSQPLASREALEEALQAVSQRFPDEAIPRPPHWGGYRVVPSLVEFWQGRHDRTHDRLEYRLQSDGWRRQRLMP